MHAQHTLGQREVSIAGQPEGVSERDSDGDEFHDTDDHPSWETGEAGAVQELEEVLPAEEAASLAWCSSPTASCSATAALGLETRQRAVHGTAVRS